MAAVRRGRAVLAANLGLYLGIPPILVPERGLQSCNNVRIKHGRIVHDNLGWAPFPDSDDPINLDGKPVTLIDNFTTRAGVSNTIFGNTTDLFLFDGSGVVYLTPRVENGTVSVTNGSPNVVGNATTWMDDLKPGDMIHIGDDGVTDPAEDWYEILTVSSNTALVLSTNYDGDTDTALDYTARSVFTGGADSPFSTEVFYGAVNVEGTDGDRWYATNGIDPVVAWDGSSSQVYRPDLGDMDSARFVKRYKNVMVYGAPTVGGEQRLFSIRTSAIGEPENVVSAEAAEFEVHDGVDPLLTAMPIGDWLAIYAERSIIVTQFVGPPLMFVFRVAVPGFGPRSSRAVAQFSTHHLFIGADCQYLFDGSTARPVNAHVWREVTRQTDPGRLDYLHAFFDEENGELLWAVPLTSDRNTHVETAFVTHYLEDVGRNPMPHTRRDLPATVFGFYERETSLRWSDIDVPWSQFNFRWNDQFFSQGFPQILFGDMQGNIYLLNESNTKAGEPIAWFARFSRRPLGNSPARKGTVRRIYPFVEQLPNAAHDMAVRLRVSDTMDGPSRLASEIAYPMAERTAHFVAPRQVGRFCEVEFGMAEGELCAFTGYDMEVVNAGAR